MTNRHVYSTIAYSRNKGVLRKEDYIFMRECLEKQLEYMQLSDFDYSQQIDDLKLRQFLNNLPASNRYYRR